MNPKERIGLILMAIMVILALAYQNGGRPWRSSREPCPVREVPAAPVHDDAQRVPARSEAAWRADLTRAMVQHRRGVELMQAEQFDQAARALEEAARLRERVVGAEDPGVGLIRRDLAIVWFDQGRYRQALAVMDTGPSPAGTSLGTGSSGSRGNAADAGGD